MALQKPPHDVLESCMSTGCLCQRREKDILKSVAAHGISSGQDKLGFEQHADQVSSIGSTCLITGSRLVTDAINAYLLPSSIFWSGKG